VQYVNLYVGQVQFPNGAIIDKHCLLDFKGEEIIHAAEREPLEETRDHSSRHEIIYAPLLR
jgi:hypothetical protein